MKKRIFAFALALCLCLTLLPAAVLADSGADVHANHCVCGATHTAVGDHTTESVITDWQEWPNTTSLPTEPGNYYLKENVTISSRQTIQKDNTVTLCLNGKTIIAVNANFDTEYILVEGTLNLTDCTGDGKITSANYDTPGNKVLVVSSKSGGGTLNLYGGTITKINTGKAGITDPYGSSGEAYNGGGVRNEGTFNMYGGAITENKTRSGGGVYNQGTFTMYGGTISKNNAAGNAGGGVFNTGGGTFNLCGGTISGNIAKQTTGNDVHNWNGGKINANGGTVEGAVYNQKGIIATTDEATSATTFNGAVTNGDSGHNGTISGGTYNGTVTNNKTISGGTFTNTVTNGNGGAISGGTFYQQPTGGETSRYYTVTLNPNGGTIEPTMLYVVSGCKASEPADPTREGYTFDGWCTDENGTTAFDFSNVIDDNITLYAKWTENAQVAEDNDLAWLLPIIGALDKEPFDDVTSRDWFYDDVNYVYEYGLMTGTGTRTFSPDAPVTRGMVMTILARREGIMTDRYSPWYAAGVEWAVVNGISDGSNPEAEITREELATMFYRYAQLKGYDVSVGADTNILSFLDALEISDYAFEPLQWAVGSGLMNGSNGRLTPRATATRAQLAAMLHRFFG